MAGLALRLSGLSDRLASGPVDEIVRLAGALVMGALGWRRAPDPHEGLHGTARFAEPGERTAGLARPEGLIIGQTRQGRLLRHDGPGHLLTLAPTRSGKGVGAVIPNLLMADRAVICIDPKGENAKVCAGARLRFGPVHVLDPFGASGLPSQAYDPLVALDPGDPDLSDRAFALAEALVHDAEGQAGEAHWNEEARALIAGVILHVVTTPQQRSAGLLQVRDHLTCAPEAFRALLKTMQASPAAQGLVARAANRHLAKSDREAAGVLSSAQRHTHFLDSPRLSRVLGRCDFSLQDLPQNRASLFIVLPPDRLATHSRWMRLLLVQALGELAASGPPPATSPGVLFLLDEFAALGRLEPVERAYGLMAGYGVQLWAILQDLHQLRALYGPSSGTFLSNAGVIQVFNVAELDTATWVSRTLGASTELQTSTTQAAPGLSQLLRGAGRTITRAPIRRELLTPDEVMRLSPDRLILLRPGHRPVLAWKVRYFAQAIFRDRITAYTAP